MGVAFPHLFSPVRLGPIRLRNRVAFTAHGTGLGVGNLPDERLVAYYEARAAGGVGLIIVGAMQVHRTSPGITNLLCNYDERIVPGLQQITHVIKRHGAVPFAQLSHMGGASSAFPAPLWAPSRFDDDRFAEVAHEMTPAEIQEIVAAFGTAAQRACCGGFDGIEVQASHGLLLAQFLSPRTNRRRDGYGGDAEGRLRFLVEVLEVVRHSVGSERAVGIRLSGDELIPGGLGASDLRKVARRLAATGLLDYVNVTAGNDTDLRSLALHVPPMGGEAAPFASLASGIRAVTGLPVVHATRVHDPAVAERLIAAGDIDVMGSVRAFIADAAWANKAKQGQLDEIIPCIACNQSCLGRLHTGRHVTCIHNPVSGREVEWGGLRPAKIARRVVIVGGGPAGLEAAVIAATRGHRVILYEREHALGGQVRLAAAAPTRAALMDVVTYRTRRMARLGVEVRLGEEATASDLRHGDVAIIATGARRRRATIAGAEHAVTAWEVLAGAPTGECVVIVDQTRDLETYTTAEFLARQGKRVSIVTSDLAPGRKIEQTTLHLLLERLGRLGVSIHTSLRIDRLLADSVEAHNVFSGQTITLRSFDSIVVASGGEADDGLAQSTWGAGIDVASVGDCVAPRNIEAAILEAHRVARAV